MDSVRSSTMRGSPREGGIFNPIVDLPQSDAADFYEEAGIGPEDRERLHSAFCRFRGTNDPPSDAFSLEDFCRLAAHYRLCKPGEEDAFFYAMDRTRDGCLDFEEFCRGCCAADASTLHVVNSFTGYDRLRYIFDFYNCRSKSGFLTFRELAALIRDARNAASSEDLEVAERHASEVAQRLGDVDTVTLHLRGIAGQLRPLLASRWWTWLTVKQELALSVGVPAEDQRLVLDAQVLLDETCINAVLPDSASSLDVTLVCSRGEEPRDPLALAVPELVTCRRPDDHGLVEALDADLQMPERLVHVEFKRLLQSVSSEQLRGTSRLFRFRRSLLKALGKAQHGSNMRVAARGGA